MLVDLHNPQSASSLPTLAQDTALVTREVQDYQQSLVGGELAGFAQASSRSRQLQFSSGRHCLRICQDLLGTTHWPVPNQGRMPVWQSPWHGSISHSDTLAVAVLSSHYGSIGVDLEQADRLQPPNSRKLLQRLFRPEELARLQDVDVPSPWTAAFSAKEAGYKAIYPLGRTYIGFQEVAVALHTNGTFTFKYFGANRVNKRLEQGQGYWLELDNHILTLFVIDVEAASTAQSI